MESNRGNSDWPDRVGLVALAAVTLAAAAGFAVFGRNPRLVASVPGAAEIFPIAYSLSPHIHMWTAAAVAAVILTRAVGWRWLAALALTYAISLGAELLGTSTGVPFGAYAYSRSLEPFWFDHVPIAIPVSWFTMALPAYVLVTRRVAKPVGAILAAAALLTTWDLVLDPAMSGATSYWRWAEPGPYYGMPWINLAGWMLTGTAIMAGLELIGAREWARRVPHRAMVWLYALQFVLPLVMAAAAGFWGAILAAVVALGVLGFLLRAPRAPRAPAPHGATGPGFGVPA